MRPAGVHHIAIKVADLRACERFYTDELGLRKQSEQPGRSVWLELGEGVLLMLEQGEGTADAGPLEDRACGLHLVALRIARADRVAWAARLQVAGATAYTLYVRDPEGNRIGLSHWPEPAEM
jgi:catechol 2,3-dioxygenase-like lactoylglutathione lyase family enzyme